MSGKAAMGAIAFLVGSLGLHFGAFADQIPKKISNATAKLLAAKATGWRPNDFDYGDAGQTPPFFTYIVLSGPPAEGGAAGYFSVNPWTGDVWALWGCKRLSTPALEKALEKIKLRFTADEMKEYDRLRVLKPDCIVDDSDP